MRWKSLGILKDSKIVEAFEKVDRKDFVPKHLVSEAYEDHPLQIGGEQTISQPSTVAIMTQSLEPRKSDKVLEVGAGSGWQAAILSVIVEPGKVYTIERVNGLAELAKKNLEAYGNVQVILSDGSKGLPSEAPFDRIIVACGAEKVPEALKEQLAEGGVMVIPVGRHHQRMLKIRKKKGLLEVQDLGSFVFVPLIED